MKARSTTAVQLLEHRQVSNDTAQCVRAIATLVAQAVDTAWILVKPLQNIARV